MAFGGFSPFESLQALRLGGQEMKRLLGMILIGYVGLLSQSRPALGAASIALVRQNSQQVPILITYSNVRDSGASVLVDIKLNNMTATWYDVRRNLERSSPGVRQAVPASDNQIPYNLLMGPNEIKSLSVNSDYLSVGDQRAC